MPGEGVSEVHLSTVNYSHSMVLTGFSEMSQRTRFTPGNTLFPAHKPPGGYGIPRPGADGTAFFSNVIYVRPAPTAAARSERAG